MTIEEYCKSHNMRYGDLAGALGVSKSKLSHVMNYHQRPNKQMVDGFQALGIDYPLKDIDYMANVRTAKIKQLVRENAELKRENARLRAVIHNKLDVALERLISDIHHKSVLRRYHTKLERDNKGEEV